MVTEIGFVSLLVAGLGGLAGGLIYLAVRISRGRRW
ncbi:small membrane protein MtfM [Micromonospora sp. CPCC 205539]